jgi:hypothetical protein
MIEGLKKEGARGEDLPQFSGGNPIDQLAARTRDHQKRDHLIASGTYRLSETELGKATSSAPQPRRARA